MLDYVLFAESDRMGHLLPVLDQKKLDLQRGVVQNEKRQDENQPYAVSEELITENTYPEGHPYSWTVIGSMKDLDAASLTDVQEWFKTYYGPNNVTLVLAGDITPEVARQKVEKYYGAIPAGPPIAQARKHGSPSAPARIAARCRTCSASPHLSRLERPAKRLARRSLARSHRAAFSAREKLRASTSASSTRIKSRPAPAPKTTTTKLPANFL